MTNSSSQSTMSYPASNEASTKDLLTRCAAFLSGFEDDHSQEGLQALLAEVRAAAAAEESAKSKPERVELTLAIKEDGPGQVVLTVEQIQDVVDQSIRLVLLDRAGADEEFDIQVGEPDEALVAAGVVGIDQDSEAESLDGAQAQRQRASATP